MNRRLLTILTAGAAASLAAGCSTLDTDAIASVGDTTLSDAQLSELVPLVGGGDEALPAADRANVNRTAISVWLEAQVFTQAFADSGVELDPAAIDQSTQGLNAQFAEQFTELSPETRDLLVEYVTVIEQLPALPRPDDADVRSWFNAGPERSGLACVTHILVETEDEAQDIVDELAATDSEAAEAELFASIAMERSIDPGSGAAGGFLSCDVAANIGEQYVPPFAAAALAAEPGVPTEPVESEFGFHVLRLLPFDEAGAQIEQFYAQGYVQARLTIEDADVTVDSRYGVADGVNVVAAS
ncbi:MAG: peptidylprolyl isomerase [Ilumatobacter sp.]|uniref:peptidylprolyl isomerase n=1 Tax=Ilumatobacter sp. TaxID=1967498 RepID=UPI003C7242E0